MFKFSEDEKNRIIQEYFNRANLPDLSKKYGMSDDTLRRYLKAWGVYSGRIRPFDAKERTNIIHLYTNVKLSATSIGELYNVSQAYVLKNLHKWQVSIRKHPKRSSYMEANKEAIIRDCAILAARTVSKKYQISRVTLYSYLRKWGIERSGRIFFSESDKQAIISLYAGGVSMDDIAAKFGVSQVTVHNRLLAWDVPIRHKNRNIVISPDIMTIVSTRLDAGESLYNISKDYTHSFSYATLRRRFQTL